MPEIVVTRFDLLPVDNNTNVQVKLDYTISYRPAEITGITNGTLQLTKIIRLVANDTGGWVWNIQPPPPITLDGTVLYSEVSELTQPTTSFSEDFEVTRESLNEDPGIFGGATWIFWTGPDDDEIRAKISISALTDQNEPVVASFKTVYSPERTLTATEGYRSYITRRYW